MSKENDLANIGSTIAVEIVMLPITIIFVAIIISISYMAYVYMGSI